MGIPFAVVALLAVNGAAQSTGWPSVLKLTRDWFPGIILAVIAVLCLTIARDKSRAPCAPAVRTRLTITRPLIAISAMYFCVKLTRYAFLFWLPLYMTEHLQYAKPLAGYASSGCEMFGILGALAAGYASERTGGSRFPVGAFMMLVLAVLCATYPAASSTGLYANLAWILHDAVPSESTASAAGFVNGVGSPGQVLSPMAVAYLSSRFGWAALFTMLSLLVLCGALALATQCIRMPARKQEVLS